MNKTGTVYLVGAGPGELELLTLRGAEFSYRSFTVVAPSDKTAQWNSWRHRQRL